jgi:hypothetical protein
MPKATWPRRSLTCPEVALRTAGDGSGDRSVHVDQTRTFEVVRPFVDGTEHSTQRPTHFFEFINVDDMDLRQLNDLEVALQQLIEQRKQIL